MNTTTKKKGFDKYLNKYENNQKRKNIACIEFNHDVVFCLISNENIQSYIYKSIEYVHLSFDNIHELNRSFLMVML